MKSFSSKRNLAIPCNKNHRDINKSKFAISGHIRYENYRNAVIDMFVKLYNSSNLFMLVFKTVG